jgi:hypothetical protein
MQFDTIPHGYHHFRFFIKSNGIGLSNAIVMNSTNKQEAYEKFFHNEILMEN